MEKLVIAPVTKLGQGHFVMGTPLSILLGVGGLTLDRLRSISSSPPQGGLEFFFPGQVGGVVLPGKQRQGTRHFRQAGRGGGA
jgi:hypothetical protein